MSACVQCGADVPEGYGHICPDCETHAMKRRAYAERQRADRLREEVHELRRALATTLNRLRDANRCEDCAKLNQRCAARTPGSFCLKWRCGCVPGELLDRLSASELDDSENGEGGMNDGERREHKKADL